MESIAKCTRCDKTQKSKPSKDGGLKIPKGWRRISGEFVCRDCTKKTYYTRGFRVEIRGLAENEERDIAEFRKVLSAASRASARFGNWLVQRLYTADLALAPTLEKAKDGKDKMPPCPNIDYYRDAVATFPELSGGCISGLGQMIRGWYSARRFDALVRLNRSVENYRFGYLPVEVRKQDWSLRAGDDGKLVMRCAVQPGKSWTVKIYADKSNYVRLRQIVEGDAIPLGCKIVRGSKQSADGKPRKAWFFRVSAMFPRTERKQSTKEVCLSLGHESSRLLYGSAGDDTFEFPGVELRKMIVGGDISDRRHQQEASMQRGIWSKRKIKRWGIDRTLRCESRQRKIAMQIKLIAASLGRWCKSHGVTSVDYDITDRGFIPHFPWRKLQDDIANVLEREGIKFRTHSQTNQEESEALVGPGSETA